MIFADIYCKIILFKFVFFDIIIYNNKREAPRGIGTSLTIRKLATTPGANFIRVQASICTSLFSWITESVNESCYCYK